MMPCPVCGSDACILPAESVLEMATSLYVPCLTCSRDAPIDKLRPVLELGIDLEDKDAYRCPECGKRHIDVAMAQALVVLIERGVKGNRAALKDIGTPMVEYGVPMLESPRLGPKSVILIVDNIDKAAAEEVMARVPEVKGVLNRMGNPKESVGILDTDSRPHVYDLMAGCDVRADVISSMLGDLVLYRRQGDTHIEFYRTGSTKIKTMEKLFLDGAFEGKTVLDGMASVGTLGMYAALAGAKKVILNDAWKPAVEFILINLNVNRNVIGVETDMMADLKGLQMIAGEPTLIARSTGLLDIEVYHSDLRKLDMAVPYCDVCIIDTFPGADPAPFVKKWKALTSDMVITL